MFLVAFAGLFVVLVSTVLSRDAGERQGPTPGGSLPPVSTLDPSADSMCSEDSEGESTVGWGPDRPMFYDDTYPNALTFNSTAENPNLGDERNFVGVKKADIVESGGWLDSIKVSNGVEYVVRVFVRLDGPTSHDAANTALKIYLPTCTAHRIGVSALLSADDVFPRQIWDGVEFWSRRDFNLVLVPDSAWLANNAHPSPGLPLPTGALVSSEGTSLGYEKTDGLFKSGYEYDGYVTFEVRAQVSQP